MENNLRYQLSNPFLSTAPCSDDAPYPHPIASLKGLDLSGREESKELHGYCARCNEIVSDAV